MQYLHYNIQMRLDLHYHYVMLGRSHGALYCIIMQFVGSWDWHSRELHGQLNFKFEGGKAQCMPGFRAMPTNCIYCSSQVKLTEDEIEAVSMLRVDNSASHAGAGSHPAPDPRYLSPSSYATAVQSKRQR